MPKRLLAIGVGGSGKNALTILKERLVETYGNVPENVVLLSLDTDSLRDIDQFAGVSLNTGFVGQREPEFQQVVSKPGMTMDTIFANLSAGTTAPYMHWLEKEKLDRMLGPAERDIRGGAQQRRPIGRVAVFQRWDAPILSSIRNAIERMYGEPDQEQDIGEMEGQVERGKRLIFIIGSVAGGTGSGFLIDIANLVRHAVQSNENWQSVDVSAIIVLPDAFQVYTQQMNDPTNLRPNSFAALRELDRFVRSHSGGLPYMIRYDDDTRSITWSTNQPLDHIYLVDTASREGIGDFNLQGDPMTGVFPIIADFMMAHVDQSLGDALATLRSNAGQNYSKQEGWQYSGFNVKTYIFPVNDVIKSFSYRFLRELISRLYLPVHDDKRALNSIEQEALREMEQVFTQSTVGNKVNPVVVQKTIAVTRQLDPEYLDITWQGLFNLIALSDSSFARDYQTLEGHFKDLAAKLVPSREGQYKSESFDQGYQRLMDNMETFMQQNLGPQTEIDNDNSRMGGEWDNILLGNEQEGRTGYEAALRQRFAEALDRAILDILNRRSSQTRELLNHRLPVVRAMLTTMKTRLRRFQEKLMEEYQHVGVEHNLRRASEELRNTIDWMNKTKNKRPSLFGKSEAQQAQETFIVLFNERMELLLHQRLYQTVMGLLDALGAAEQDSQGYLSVLDQASVDLGHWNDMFEQVDLRLKDQERLHKQSREDKRKIKVRYYMTNPALEDTLYTDSRVAEAVHKPVYGQEQGQSGLLWRKKTDDEKLFSYELETSWASPVSGTNEMVQEFFTGAMKLFQVVRTMVTASDRVAEEFTSSSSFVNTVEQINQPFLRYNQQVNGKQMFHEHYVSFNTVQISQDKARKFFDDARTTLAKEGLNVDTQAESLVACTIVEVARGVRLSAVEQMRGCEPDYWSKLSQGRESLHLFSEEQLATDYERRIETLGDPDNTRRLFSPELVVALGDERKLRAFVLACAYGLVEVGTYVDEETNQESTEVLLTLRNTGEVREYALSQSDAVRLLDPSFLNVSAQEQEARLFLNALQNFVLKVTDKEGLQSDAVPTVVQELTQRGVRLDHIKFPFRLSVNDVNAEIRRFTEALGPTAEEVSDRKQRDATNAKRRITTHLDPFLKQRVVGVFNHSPDQRVKDLGTVMQLILRFEINQLQERINKSQS